MFRARSNVAMPRFVEPELKVPRGDLTVFPAAWQARREVMRSQNQWPDLRISRLTRRNQSLHSENAFSDCGSMQTPIAAPDPAALMATEALPDPTDVRAAPLHLPGGHQSSTQAQPARRVELQDLDRGAASGCATENSEAIQPEMSSPVLRAWVKQ